MNQILNEFLSFSQNFSTKDISIISWSLLKVECHMFLVWTVNISIITDHKSLKEYLSHDHHSQNFNFFGICKLCVINNLGKICNYQISVFYKKNLILLFLLGAQRLKSIFRFTILRMIVSSSTVTFLPQYIKTFKVKQKIRYIRL